MALRHPQRGFEEPLLLFAIAALLLVAGAIAITLRWLGPVPPQTITMTTGPIDGDYDRFGERYRLVLERAGVKLNLLRSAGAVENIRRLEDPHSNVSVGLVQAGLVSEISSPDLISLGTLGYEPLWLFHRIPAFEGDARVLRGSKLSIGPEGSGTRALVLELLKRNGVTSEFAQLLPYTSQEAGEKLLRGEIDAAMMLSASTSPMVQRLLAADGIYLGSFRHLDAYLALYPFLSKVMVPAGVGDLAKNRPRADVFLLSTKTSLVVRKDLHPALQYLLLSAAQEIHSSPSIFKKSGQFPAPEAIDLPLSNEALQFYKSGPPFLQRYLPFWLAVFVGRLVVVLIPLLGLLFPLVRLLPMAYGWGMRVRIFRLYKELKRLELALDARPLDTDIKDLVARLHKLETRAAHTRVPFMYTDLLYTVRSHIMLVAARLEHRSRAI